VLQRKVAREQAEPSSSGRAMMWDLAHKPGWWAGIAAIIVGFGLQAGALATGPLALVQPVLVVELAFTLLLAAAVFHTRVHRRQWAAVVGMTAGLALLLYSLQPSGGNHGGAPTLRWVAGIVVVLLIVGVLFRAGADASHDRRAAYLGVATGAGFWLTAALVAGVVGNYAAHNLSGILLGWQTYVLIVLGPGFFFALQKTMQAGSLIASQPALTLTNPIVAAVFGVAVFGEHTRTGGWLVAAFLAAALIVGATALLARSPMLDDANAPITAPSS